MRLKKRKMARKSGFGAGGCSRQVVEFGRRRYRRSRLGGMHNKMQAMEMMSFGKRRRKSGVSKSAAMKAFKRFYMSHCKPVLRRSRFGFGRGEPWDTPSSTYIPKPVICTSPSVNIGGRCVIPPPTCVYPQYLSGNTCKTPPKRICAPYTQIDPYTCGPLPPPPAGMKWTTPTRADVDRFVPKLVPKFGARRSRRFGMMVRAPPMGASFLKNKKGMTGMGGMMFGAGNPHTSAMMGYEFCPNGGGVLEGSGLYAQGCKTSSSVMAPKMTMASPVGMTGATAAFGKGYRRRVVRRRVGGRYSKVVANCAGLKKSQCQTSPGCHYVKSRGCRGRAGTRKGLVYEGPSGPPGFGRRRRRMY